MQIVKNLTLSCFRAFYRKTVLFCPFGKKVKITHLCDKKHFFWLTPLSLKSARNLCLRAGESICQEVLFAPGFEVFQMRPEPFSYRGRLLGIGRNNFENTSRSTITLPNFTSKTTYDHPRVVLTNREFFFYIHQSCFISNLPVTEMVSTTIP